MPRWATVLAVLVLVALAGCTGNGDTSDPGGGEDGAFVQQGVVIAGTDITRKQFRQQGDTATVVARIHNMNLREATDVTVSLRNYFPLTKSVTKSCSGETLDPASASTESATETLICRWEVECGADCEQKMGRISEPTTVGLTVTVDYESVLAASGAPISILFKRPSNFEASSQTQETFTVSNGDIEISGSYPGTVRSDRSRFAIDMTVTDIGGGALGSQVNVSYSGSMKENVLDTGNMPCTGFYVSGTSTSWSRTCQFSLAGSIQPDTVYDLRPTASYKYRKTKKFTLELVPSG